ncbi:MAG TPA: cyclopropane-fatty-acyl-phospholipid synthase family protein [Solirubrobacteraceae bacterium]|jgi:cyclopropane-fatty-acyl-phospholipid synthase
MLSSSPNATAQLRTTLERALPRRPFRLVLWDGSAVEPTEAPGRPTFTFRRPAAVRHVLRSPGQLGLGRAYVAGDLEVDDLDAVMRLVDGYKAEIPPRERAAIGLAALRAAGPGWVAAPSTELRLRGRQHSKARDAAAVRYHYDVPTAFFALFLDERMTYSCAIFSRGATTLEEAQETKLEMVCTKLALREGERVLDVGCGWGAFAIHAASRHGVHVTGITLSESQAGEARARVAAAGLADRVEIRVADYRDLAGERFDAIASIGMVEHVGEPQIDAYARQLASLLAPGGRLLNHGIARLKPGPANAGPFNERYVFPDGDPLPLSRVQLALERAGFRTEHVEGFGADYVETLRQWAARLDEHLEEGERLAGPERLRVWRLYLRAARNGFENGHTSIYQVRAIRR